LSINPINLSRKTLQEISKISESGDILLELIDLLENKSDPDPTEVHLLNSIYQYIEKLSLLESHLQKYSRKSNIKLQGNKLNTLYENNRGYGTSKLFD